MSTVNLKDGTTARAFFFRVRGYRTVVWAPNKREAVRRAERLWGVGKAVLEVAT